MRLTHYFFQSIVTSIMARQETRWAVAGLLGLGAAVIGIRDNLVAPQELQTQAQQAYSTIMQEQNKHVVTTKEANQATIAINGYLNDAKIRGAQGTGDQIYKTQDRDAVKNANSTLNTYGNQQADITRIYNGYVHDQLDWKPSWNRASQDITLLGIGGTGVLGAVGVILYEGSSNRKRKVKPITAPTT